LRRTLGREEDAKLLQQLKVDKQFTVDDKTVIKKDIDAFITKKQIQQLAQ